MEAKQPIEVFFSYSHGDEKLKNDLLKHLSVMQHQKVISAWHDRKIGAGGEWAKEIDSHLESARIILLLVSADFLASDYCYDIEMKCAMERHELAEACVIPVILRPADWSRAVFAKLKALPRDGKPVTSWQNPDEAFADVAVGIREEVDKLLERQVDPLVEKLKTAESLRNWPNVVNLGERILQVLPDHPPARESTARALVARWAKNLQADRFSGVDIRHRPAGRATIKTDGSEVDIRMQIVADVTRAIELAPANPDYYFIRSCLDLGNDERKMADLNRAIELKPQDAKYFFVRGQLFERQDNEKAADRDFNQVLDFGFRQASREPLFPPTYLGSLPLSYPLHKLPESAKWQIDASRLELQIRNDLKRIWGGEP
jgi:tetratricopeptide (TPR) repeat protein